MDRAKPKERDRSRKENRSRKGKGEKKQAKVPYYKDKQTRHVWMSEGVTERNKRGKLREILQDSGFYADLKQKCPDKDAKIVIKPNISIATQKDLPNYTDPALVDWLVSDLSKQGYKNVKIVESENLMNEFFSGHRPDVIAKHVGYKHKVKNLTKDKIVKIPYNEGKLPVAQTMLDADYIVNFAKGRNHPQRKMTGAIKNMFGTIPVRDKLQQFHWKESGIGMEEAAVAVHEITPPDFNIIDMIRSVDGSDEHVSTKQITDFVEPHLLLAGKDPLSIDKVLATKMGYDENEPPVTKEMLNVREDFDIKKSDITGGNLSRIRIGDREWRKVPWSTRLKWGAGVDLGLRVATKSDFITQQFKQSGKEFRTDVIDPPQLGEEEEEKK